jgi:hypothetical protein
MANTLLTICIITRVSPRMVQNLLSSRRLPARKIGRRTLIPYKSITAFARHDTPDCTEQQA